MVAYGDVKDWKPAAVGKAGDDLKGSLDRLERANDDLRAKAVPGSWLGLSSVFARARQRRLVATMESHLEGGRRLQSAIFKAETAVTTIRELVTDVESDARGQEFEISSDGTVSDVSDPPTFVSVRAAEAYTERRTTLRDALVERVQTIVDKAYEVDSALVQARPDDAFNDDGPQGVVDPQVARQWESMSEDERRAVIEQMVEELADTYGLDDPNIVIEDLEDQDGDGVDDNPGTNSHGSWSEDDQVLRLDINDLDDPHTINTVAHEVRHAAQHEQVRDANPGAFDRWLIDAGLKDDPFNPPPGVTREEVEDWEENFDNYIDADIDFEGYENQPVEADAREAGDAYVDGLTAEELERLRREAG